jgi:hypothetical protein
MNRARGVCRLQQCRARSRCFFPVHPNKHHPLKPTNQMIDNSDFDAGSSEISVSKPYRMHARVAWILMAIVTTLAFVPFLGFASWFVAIPMLLISFIMIILVFTRGGVAHGLALLVCQIIVMPLVLIFGPFISSALGLAGVASMAESSSTPSSSSARFLTAAPQTLPPTANTPAEHTGPVPQVPILTDDLRELKEKLLQQQPSVTNWLSNGLAMETASGYLKTGDSADVDSRRAVQQQNVWREKVFERIANLTGKSPEEVAQTYARLAQGK